MTTHTKMSCFQGLPPSSAVRPESAQVASAEMHLESSLIANCKWINLSLTQH